MLHHALPGLLYDLLSDRMRADESTRHPNESSMMGIHEFGKGATIACKEQSHQFPSLYGRRRAAPSLPEVALLACRTIVPHRDGMSFCPSLATESASRASALLEGIARKIVRIPRHASWLATSPALLSGLRSFSPDDVKRSVGIRVSVPSTRRIMTKNAERRRLEDARRTQKSARTVDLGEVVFCIEELARFGCELR